MQRFESLADFPIVFYLATGMDDERRAELASREAPRHYISVNTTENQQAF